MKFGDLPTEIQSKLMDYNYPGNVRELQNIIKRYLSKGELDLQAEKNNVSVYSNSISNRAYQIIDDSVTDMIEKITSTHDLPPLVELKEKILSKVEVEYVRHVLNIFKWDKQKAAAKLGISYRYLNNRVSNNFDLRFLDGH
jgi:two-component system response regulator AtoC